MSWREALADRLDPDAWPRALGRGLARGAIAGATIFALELVLERPGAPSAWLFGSLWGALVAALTLAECAGARRRGYAGAVGASWAACLAGVPALGLQLVVAEAGGPLDPAAQRALAAELGRWQRDPASTLLVFGVIAFGVALAVALRRVRATATPGAWLLAAGACVPASAGLLGVAFERVEAGLWGTAAVLLVALAALAVHAFGDAFEHLGWSFRHEPEAAELRRRLAQGRTTWERLWLRAYLGDAPAWLALLAPPRVIPREPAAWLRGLAPAGEAAVLRAAAVVALAAVEPGPAPGAPGVGTPAPGAPGVGDPVAGAPGPRALEAARAALVAWLRAVGEAPPPADDVLRSLEAALAAAGPALADTPGARDALELAATALGAPVGARRAERVAGLLGAAVAAAASPGRGARIADAIRADLRAWTAELDARAARP